jgi:uncharacterized tellurite resistance protein B-like protein
MTPRGAIRSPGSQRRDGAQAQHDLRVWQRAGQGHPMAAADVDFKTKISELKPLHRTWFATAMVAMVLADGSIDRSEVDFIVKLTSLVKDDGTVERLKKFIQFQTIPPLGIPTGIDKKTGMTMILDLIRIAVADKDFAPAEKEMIEKLGKSMGFSREELDKLVMYGFELMAKGG